MKKNKAKKGLMEYATGTGAEGVTSSGAGMGLLNMLPTVLNGAMELIDGVNPKAYSNQPIFSPATIKNMATPYSRTYAFGGVSSIEELDEQQLAELQAMAEEQGTTVEDLFEQMQYQESMQEEGAMDIEDVEIEEEPEEDTSGYGNMFTQESFAYGGKSVRNKINVEGKEVLETPDGKVRQIEGAKHEGGGVDVNVPNGTKVFSDRLKVDGKSMQQRKLSRERALNRLARLQKADPTNVLLKSTIERTRETTESEERQDMMLQKVANNIYATPKPNTQVESSGEKKTSYAWGTGNPIGTHDYMNFVDLLNKKVNQYIDTPSTRKPVVGGEIATVQRNIPTTPPEIKLDTSKIKVSSGIPGTPSTMKPVAGTGATTTDTEEEQKSGSPFLNNLGDYMGIFGNAFNAIAPIVNTKKAAANMKPNINRFLGVGRKAIEANDDAQQYVEEARTNANIEADISANTAYERNRNSATSVNTVRALDSVVDMGKARTKRAANDSFSGQMINLLNNRGNIEFQKDITERKGEVQRDIEDKADMDNYYSNMAQNLVNFGTNIQGMGRNINTAKSNRIDANLLSQLSQYGLEFDENGILVTKK